MWSLEERCNSLSFQLLVLNWWTILEIKIEPFCLEIALKENDDCALQSQTFLSVLPSRPETGTESRLLTVEGNIQTRCKKSIPVRVTLHGFHPIPHSTYFIVHSSLPPLISLLHICLQHYTKAVGENPNPHGHYFFVHASPHLPSPPPACYTKQMQWTKLPVKTNVQPTWFRRFSFV